MSFPPPVFYKVALHDMPQANRRSVREIFASFTNRFVLHNDRLSYTFEDMTKLKPNCPIVLCSDTMQAVAAYVLQALIQHWK
jgi:hypothetical protein